MSRFRIWFLLPLSGLIFYSLLTLGGSRNESLKTVPLPRYVTAAQVRAQPNERTAQFQGVVEAKDQATLASTMGGRLITRPVRIGDAVRKGSVIATLDPEPFLLAREQAQSRVQQIVAQLSQATAARARADQLLKGKAITQAEWEESFARAQSLEAGLAEAEAGLSEIERQVGETVIRAPFSGEITAIHSEPGEFVGPGNGIVSLTGLNSLEITVDVPESMIASISIGNLCQITFPFFKDRQLQGQVAHLGTAGSGSNLYPVRLTLPEDASIRAGFSAIVQLNFRDDASVAVPVSAVINPGSTQPQVLKIVDGQIETLPVEVNQLRQGWVSIAGAIAEGDLVVISGHAGLLDGDVVEVVQ